MWMKHKHTVLVRPAIASQQNCCCCFQHDDLVSELFRLDSSASCRFAADAK